MAPNRSTRRRRRPAAPGAASDRSPPVGDGKRGASFDAAQFLFVRSEHAWPTRHDVRRAVEELFNVKVVARAIQNRHGKPRRSRFRAGRTKDWKKAIVTLDSEHKINFF